MICQMQLSAEPRGIAPKYGQELTTCPKSRVSWRFMNISRPTQTRDANFRRIVRENAARDHARNRRMNRIESLTKIKASAKTEKPTSHMRQVPRPPEDEGAFSEGTSSDNDSTSIDSRRSWGYMGNHAEIQHTQFRSDTSGLMPWDREANIEQLGVPLQECYNGWGMGFNNDNRFFRESSNESDPGISLGVSIANPLGMNSPQSQVLLHHCTYKDFYYLAFLADCASAAISPGIWIQHITASLRNE